MTTIRREPAIVPKDAFREYLCEKVDQLLVMMGSKPLDSSQLGDRELLELDPIGTISDAFGQMLVNLHAVNERLRSEIEERKRVEQALTESEERLRDFFDNAMDLIQSVSPDGRFLYVNREWREVLGYSDEEIGRMTVFDIISPECVDHCTEMFRRIMAGERAGHLETTFRAKDGRRIVVEGHVNCRFEKGKPAASRGIFRDITDKKQLEEELRRANTLESIGILAGGIAHDFNNILTAILGYISLAKMGLDAGGKTLERLTEAEKASLRAQGLTRQLLTFAKGGAPIRQPASIGELLEESAGFALRGSNVKCRVSVDPDLSPVDIDPAQIGQVINNIVLNASQAMPAGGIVRIEARNVALTGGTGSTLRDGDYVKISIRDSGMGIPAEDVPKIFNPFFTTKEKGTGLGLATSYSIVKRHDGQISVESKVGKGTTFSLLLPVSRKKSRVVPESGGEPARAGGRVLVMDDEEMVRKVALTILESMGYQGHGARNGSEAVKSYVDALRSGNPFDVAILDLTVPGGMGGKEAVGKLLQIDPGARVLVSSGYSHDPVMSDFARYGFKGVVSKPYKIGELENALRALIAETGAPIATPNG